MRQTDKPEDQQALPPPIRKPEMPQPHKRISEHVWQGPDGKLYTDDMTPPPVVDIYTYFGLPKPKP